MVKNERQNRFPEFVPIDKEKSVGAIAVRSFFSGIMLARFGRVDDAGIKSLIRANFGVGEDNVLLYELEGHKNIKLSEEGTKQADKNYPAVVNAQQIQH